MLDIEIKEFQKIFREILKGKSLRNIEKEYGISREVIMKRFKELFAENPKELQKFEKIIEYNKSKIITVNIDKYDLENIIKCLLKNQITMEQAYTKLNIDRNTFKEKMSEYVISSNDKELMKQYIEYESKIRPDYSHINFKALLIEMIVTNSSQIQIAKEYGIPTRTIGREIEKLKENETYRDLYTICKEHAKRKMIKEEFSIFEKDLIQKLLEKYDEGSIIIKNAKTKEEQEYEKAKNIINIANNTKGKLEQKAAKVGISKSSLRRMKILVKNYEEKERIMEER